jgi:cell division protease FtsH
MKPQPPDQPSDENQPYTPIERTLSWVYVIGLVVLGIAVNLWLAPQRSVTLDYSDFKRLVRDAKVQQVEVAATSITGTAMLHEAQAKLPPAAQAALAKSSESDPVPFSTTRIDDTHLIADLERAGVRFSGAPDRGWISGLLSWLIPLILLVGF